MQKQLEGTQSIFFDGTDEVARYRWAKLSLILMSNTHALQRSINA